MSRKNAVKSVLFSLSSLAALSAYAGEVPSGDLRLLEELPVEQRVAAHEQVLNYLNDHPEVAADAKVIAVDHEGTVYVLDENMEPLADAGAPSGIGKQQ